jgi:hypothetical protein
MPLFLSAVTPLDIFIHRSFSSDSRNFNNHRHTLNPLFQGLSGKTWSTEGYGKLLQYIKFYSNKSHYNKTLAVPSRAFIHEQHEIYLIILKIQSLPHPASPCLTLPHPVSPSHALDLRYFEKLLK